ncbi:histidine--tRNA ligase [bacterium]|nr:histidine--tRNA ligase [bacterium]
MSQQRKVQAVRGMGDVLPVGQKQFIYQSDKWTWVRSQFAAWVEAHGYRYIETPVIEEIELFKRTSGETSDIVNKEMFLVKRSSTAADEGEGFDLCLRPEGSAGVCRAVVEHGLARSQSGLKFYYMAPMFRSERPQRGRYRQHTQLGAEIFKEAAPSADVEVIAMLVGFYQRLGLTQLTVHLNSVGDAVCRPRYREVLIAFLEQFKDRMSEDSLARLYTNPMRCLDSKDPRDQELFADAPKMVDHLSDECLEHFEEVKRGLTKLGIPFELDPKLVRGLDYYTKTAFEVKCQTLDGAIKTIGGGGRYDGLVEQLGGSSTPGIGFGSGIERVLLALESQGIIAPPVAPPRVLVAYMDAGVKYDAMAIAEGLRRHTISTEFMYTAKNLGRQLKEAGDKDVDYVVIVGGTEWDNGEVAVKNFRTREQQNLPAGEVVAHVAKCILG